MSKAEVLLKGLFFPEGPLVLDERVLFVEQGLGQVSILSEHRRECYVSTGGSPNSVVLGRDGCAYVAQNGGAVGPWRSETRITAGIQRIDANLVVSTAIGSSDRGPLRAPNDLVFDRTGQLWFTDPGQPFDSENRYADGWICKVDGFGNCQVVVNLDPAYPNGIRATADGRVVWVETYERDVCMLSEQGRQVLCQLPELHFPDGMAEAEDGRLFIASTFAHTVAVISPEGDFTGELYLDGDAFPTNCCFDGSDLLVTDFGPDWRTGEGSGRLWRVPTDARGAEVFYGEVNGVA